MSRKIIKRWNSKSKIADSKAEDPLLVTHPASTKAFGTALRFDLDSVKVSDADSQSKTVFTTASYAHYRYIKQKFTLFVNGGAVSLPEIATAFRSASHVNLF